MTTENEILTWFKEKYGLKNYKFAMRKFLPKAIIVGEKRHKVVDVYPEKIDGLYFVVYNRKYVRETAYSDNFYGNIFAEHSVRITHNF